MHSLTKDIGQHRQPAVFLDRDGTINRLILERGSRETPCTAEDFELLPNVKQSLLALKKAGYLLIVVTNQPNVAKGKSTWADVKAIDNRFVELVGGPTVIDGIYACHHHPDKEQVVVSELLSNCDCRKPKPGLFTQALLDFDIDLQKSWMVGDALTDMEAGKKAGILVEHLIFVGEPTNATICTVDDLWAATQIILTSQH